MNAAMRKITLSKPTAPEADAPTLRSTFSASVRIAQGILAMMPAIMIRLMPLPMPYSSICSPSHIRKTVPAVIPTTPIRSACLYIPAYVRPLPPSNFININAWMTQIRTVKYRVYSCIFL